MPNAPKVDSIISTRYQGWTFAFCILFGLALIANTMSANEGVWSWYAVLFNGGRHLYSDMHLPLQPFYVLESAGFMRLLGDGWLISKVMAVGHLVAYAVSLLLLARFSDWSDRQKAIVFGCAFFVSISSRLERFDDYHLLADSFQVYSLALLLLLQKSTSTRRSLWIVAGLGILTGLSLTTRANDGAALMLGVAIAITCLAPFRRSISLALFVAIATLTLTFIVHLTGDSLSAFASNTIFRAAGLKGGAGGVLASPLLLPFYSLHYFLFRRVIAVSVCCLVAVLAWTFLLAPAMQSGWIQNKKRVALGLILTILPLYSLRPWKSEIALLSTLALLAVYVLYGMGFWIFIRFLRWRWTSPGRYTWNPLEILLLIPLGQLMSSSMSSGGQLPENFGPAVILVLLVTIASPISIKPGSVRSVFLAAATVLMCCAVIFKVRMPYSWFSFEAKPMFVGRQWYRHPVYGPMVLETDMLKFIAPVCQNVGMNNPDTELLSLPYPFANYFCSVAPWHGYVQTWFDTSTKITIDNIEHDLQTAPPKWIFYQKQQDVLELHEAVYSKGQPLPFRALDRLIEQKLARGEWQIIYSSDYSNSEAWKPQWLLIRTHP